MWATPDDERVLLAPSERVAAFVTAIYDFDDVRVGALDIASDGRRTTARWRGSDGTGSRVAPHIASGPRSGDELEVALTGGRLRPVPFPRPRAVTRYIEAPIARALMAVETYGTSPTGAREWYQTRGWRWVVDGRASVDGRDLGRPMSIDRPVGVGFSEPPRRPSIVSVRVAIELADADSGGRPSAGAG